MTFQRLREMGLDEIVARSRQEASKWLERAGGPRAIHVSTSSARRGDASPIAEDRFFAGALSAGLPQVFAARMPQARDEVFNAAYAAGQHRFDLLGYTQLSFGDPIDWHLDPVCGHRAPLRHWSQIDALDHATVGDSKVIWELNRHQWLVRLGQAYRLSGDERYGARFAEAVDGWMEANPRAMGINWASSLEVSLRLIAWCWCLCLFRGARALTPQLRDRLSDGIDAHAAHVERYLSTYYSPNTHLTGEALGLFYAGTLFPDRPAARRRRSLGRRILVEQCARQVLSDGAYFEQATGYQRYTLEFYLHFLILSARYGREAAPIVVDRVHRMLNFVLAIRRPDGSMPNIGDADSGSLLPLAPRAQHDFRGVFATAAVLLGRTDCAWAAGSAAPEILWLFGPQGLATFDALQPAPPVVPSSQCLVDGGYVVMQSGWEATRHQLSFDTGKLGCPVTGGHGHADLLSVQCAVFGEPYIVDAGTFTYTGDPASRAFFRGTSAHSTVMVDDEPQAASTGPFRWSERPRATLNAFHSEPRYDYADARHTAFSRPGARVVHRRRVVFVKSKGWVIADDITGTGTHKVDVRFQFAPMPVSVDSSQHATALGGAGGALHVTPFTNRPIEACVCSGAVSPMQGWISQEYGRREPAPLLTYTATAELPLRIITVLLPTADPRVDPPAFTPLYAPGPAGTPTGLVFDDGAQVLFDDLGIRFDESDRVRACLP